MLKMHKRWCRRNRCAWLKAHKKNQKDSYALLPPSIYPGISREDEDVGKLDWNYGDRFFPLSLPLLQLQVERTSEMSFLVLTFWTLEFLVFTGTFLWGALSSKSVPSQIQTEMITHASCPQIPGPHYRMGCLGWNMNGKHEKVQINIWSCME